MEYLILLAANLTTAFILWIVYEIRLFWVWETGRTRAGKANDSTAWQVHKLLPRRKRLGDYWQKRWTNHI